MDAYQMLIDTRKRIEIKKAKEKAEAISKYVKAVEQFKQRKFEQIKSVIELTKFYLSMPNIVAIPPSCERAYTWAPSIPVIPISRNCPI